MGPSPRGGVKIVVILGCLLSCLKNENSLRNIFGEVRELVSEGVGGWRSLRWE